jgi:SAM-dependent methyltransferase
MLYHVPDLDRGVSELARALRPGGRLVVVTNSGANMPELWSLVGEQSETAGSFSAENGAGVLRRHFARVDHRDARGTVTFANREAARAYVAASIVGPHLAARLPTWDGPLVCTRLARVFVAESAA